jgi:hypothetical protein
MNDTALERGREAASHGDWALAFRSLREADTTHGLSAEDLALLAGVSYAAAIWTRQSRAGSERTPSTFAQAIGWPRPVRRRAWPCICCSIPP